MNQLEELKKKLECAKCRKAYSETTRTYQCERCRLYVCYSCANSGSGYHFAKCPRCNYELRYHEFSLYKDIYTALNMYESKVAKSAEDEKQLKDEISVFKQQQTVYEATQEDLRKNILKLEKELKMTREDQHKCSECETKDSELNLQLCATCHDLKFEDTEDVKECALCSTCAIKKHMRQGHRTVDFFPYLSAYSFSLHSPKIESQSEELQNSRDTLNKTFSVFNALSINVSEKYNVLTDMARRSKSTKNLLEFVEKMEGLINESKLIHVGADSELRERTKLLQEILTKVNDWYNTRMDNCVDESETIKLEALSEPKNH